MAKTSSWMDWIPIALQAIGTITSGSAASQASGAAAQASKTQEELLQEYLREYRAMGPYRRAVGNALSTRATERPFYASTWGAPRKKPPYQAPEVK